MIKFTLDNIQNLAPNILSCPECGARRRDHDFDPEGACECINGHMFWDTNSPEWQIITRLRCAERTLTHYARYEKESIRIRDALAELVRLRLLKLSDPKAYAIEDEQGRKDQAWREAAIALDETADDA